MCIFRHNWKKIFSVKDKIIVIKEFNNIREDIVYVLYQCYDCKQLKATKCSINSEFEWNIPVEYILTKYPESNKKIKE